MLLFRKRIGQDHGMNGAVATRVWADRKRRIMSEVANEESELTQELGQLVRVLTGSGMQYQEARFRREQMRAAEQARMQQQQHAHNKALANLVHETLHDRQFWATAGSEAIADNVIAAAHLSQDHPKAQQAYMHAADMLRNDFGINLEDINRDHPTALSDRHAALRDSLDSYFEGQREQAGETDKAEQLVDKSKKQPTFQEAREWHAKHFPDAHREWEMRYQYADTVDGKRNDERDLVDKMVSHRDAAREAAAEEQASLRKANQYHAEHQQDKNHAKSEAATGGREPNPYQRVTTEQYAQLRNTTSEWLATSRHRQGLMFAGSTKDRALNGRASKINMPKPQNKAYQGLNRQHDIGMAR